MFNLIINNKKHFQKLGYCVNIDLRHLFVEDRYINYISNELQVVSSFFLVINNKKIKCSLNNKNNKTNFSKFFILNDVIEDKKLYSILEKLFNKYENIKGLNSNLLNLYNLFLNGKINASKFILYYFFYDKLNFSDFLNYINIDYSIITRKSFKKDIMLGETFYNDLVQHTKDIHGNIKIIKFCADKPGFIFVKNNITYKLLSHFEFYKIYFFFLVFGEQTSLVLPYFDKVIKLELQGNNILFLPYKYGNKLKSFTKFNDFLCKILQLHEKINNIYIEKFNCKISNKLYYLTYCFQHHDLHIDNILKYGNKNVAIDYESVHFAPIILQPFYFFCSFKSNWNKGFKSKIKNIDLFFKIFNLYSNNKHYLEDISILGGQECFNIILKEMESIFWFNTVRNNSGLDLFKKQYIINKEKIIDYFNNYHK